MKKLILSLVLLTIITTTIVANDTLDKLTEQQIKTMLCHKWKLTFLEYKGKKKEIPKSVPVSLLVFLVDGKLQEFEGSKKYDGTWTYNHTTKTITTIDKDGTEKHAIIDLSNEDFVMNGKYKGFIFNMGFKKAD